VHALRPLNERLVIMTRRASDGQVASTIAAERKVPVLLLEPLELPTANIAPMARE
jgi:hypothetical protein